MSSPAPTPKVQRLKGLDPMGLAGLLSEAQDSPPAVPGWEVGVPLGEGGLGTVWKARRVSDNTAAAIKVPKSRDVALVERLEVEAEALGSLDHPNIVRLLESGPLEGGSLYLAMEFVDGPVLSQVIPGTGFHASRAYDLFRQIAVSVVHAHRRGVLHRDLKPGNVLLDSSGQARVADFGLAHSIHDRVQRLSLTVTGLIAGTAEYLPPEAYRAGFEPDVSTDIYALGVILHELLTGHPPRGAWQAVSLVKQDVDIRVDDLLKRALDPNPAGRFASVQAMVDELDGILRTPGRYAGTPRVTRQIRFLDGVWSLLGLFVFFGAAGLVVRIEKYGFKLPVDLIGTEPIQIGTWQAVFLLLCAFVPMGLWQIFRLWRFRKVPLREALPAPFGIKLGTSRTAGLVVLLAQVFLVISPGVMASWSWREMCTTWLQETDSPWTRGLVVTEGYRGRVAYDPWDWPIGKKEYSLRERSGWINDPLGTDHDHTNFIPGLMPRLAAGLGGFYALTVLLTLVSAMARWWRFRKWRHAAILIILVTFAAQQLPAEMAPHSRPRAPYNRAALNDWTRGANSRLATVALNAVIGARFISPLDDAATLQQQFAPVVQVGVRPAVRREEVLSALEQWSGPFRSPHRTLVTVFNQDRARDRIETFIAPLVNEDFTDPPSGPATGALTVILAYGEIVPGYGVAIDRVQHHTAPLWSVEPTPLSELDAAAWAASLFERLSVLPPAGAQDPLDELFLPRLLGAGFGFAWEAAPEARPLLRGTVLANLRGAYARGARPKLSGLGVEIENLPGAVRRAHLKVTDRGHLSDWTVDLVHSEGRWQSARIFFGN